MAQCRSASLCSVPPGQTTHVGTTIAVGSLVWHLASRSVLMAEVDRELLLSVTGGLGGLVEDDHGKAVYCKDEDCLGEPDWATQATC